MAWQKDGVCMLLTIDGRDHLSNVDQLLPIECLPFLASNCEWFGDTCFVSHMSLACTQKMAGENLAANIPKDENKVLLQTLNDQLQWK